MRFIRVLLLSLVLMLSGCASMGAYVDKRADLYATTQPEWRLTDTIVHQLGENPYDYAYIHLPKGYDWSLEILGYSTKRGLLILKSSSSDKYSSVYMKVKKNKTTYYKLSKDVTLELWWTGQFGEVWLILSVHKLKGN